MDLTARQYQVLDDLGISVWQRRNRSPAAPASVGIQPVDTVSADVSGIMLLVMADTELNDDKQRLLGAMLKSVNLTLEQVSVIERSAFARLSAEALIGKPVLLMGDVSPAELAAQRCYTCPDLEQMLQQPELKASAWQALKQLKTAF